MTRDERLKTAAQCYADGCTCAQAVFCAFLDEIHVAREDALRLMEGYGGGFGGAQEVCGALSAATAVISYCTSNGKPGAQSNRQEVYRRVRQAAELFRREYGGVTCRDVLRGQPPQALRCGLKVKDAVLITHQVIGGQTCTRCAP
ncbi:MAG TPA: C-GCAxxG-C-C family protein [Candidatus Butyricicoccus stercorigallinarum]|nr:C-GCAxxG-C-C family protein [Candidatus Butyricicoccus stercorigallinarum]